MDHDSAVFVFLSLLVGLGTFADYTLSPLKGAAAPAAGGGVIGLAADKITHLNISFTMTALIKTRDFLDHIFGPRIVSLTKIGRVAAVSAFLVLGVFVFSHMLSDTAWRLASDRSLGPVPTLVRIVALTVSLLFLIFFNVIFDVISLTVVRHFLAPFGTQRPKARGRRAIMWRLAFLPVYALLVYLCFVTTMNLAFSFIMMIRGAVAGYIALGSAEGWQTLLEIQANIFSRETIYRFLDPIGEGSAIAVGDTTLLLFCITPLLPALLVIIAVSGGLVLDLLDSVSAGAVGERLASAGRRRASVFQTAAIVISIIGTLAAAAIAAAGAL